MRTLRFCFLTTFYPPYHFGGDAVGVQRLARALVRRGHEVTVIHDVDAFRLLHDGPEPEAAGEEPLGLTVHALRSSLGLLSPLLTQQLGRPVANGARIRAILAARRFDVIHYHNVSLLGGPGLLSLGDAVKLYTAHEHWLVCPTHVLWRHQREPCAGRQCLRCTLAYRRPPQIWRWTGLLERKLSEVDLFIAASEFSRRKHTEFGFPFAMDVLPYFLPDDEPPAAIAGGARPHERPYFLFVGRLERIKGLDDVIPLFRERRAADLLVVGEGTHGAELRRLARGMEGVRFLGRVPQDVLESCYSHALALVVPSAGFETFGIIAIEAFRHCLPVIARRIGPLPEIVETSGGGELFTSPEELEAVLRRFERDPDLRRRLGEAGHAAFRIHWCESAVLPRYLDLVRRAAERRGVRHVVETLS